MVSKLSLTVLLTLLFTSLVASQWWDQKPFMEWSARETDEILTSSPWVKGIPLALRGYSRLQYVPWIRLLTAKPVRDALLRRISLPPVPGARPLSPTVSVVEILTETETGRLEQFVALNPTDVRVAGDETHIIIGLTVEFRGATWKKSHTTESMLPEPDALEKDTFLSIKTGRRVRVIHYDPPGADDLGAKFYFPRRMPDGCPFVRPGDKELRFDTRIGGEAIGVRFDLTKMFYTGKLEI